MRSKTETLKVQVRAVADSESRMLLKTIRAFTRLIATRSIFANGFANNEPDGHGRDWSR